jgi:hypothetical protein
MWRQSRRRRRSHNGFPDALLAQAMPVHPTYPHPQPNAIAQEEAADRV